MSLRRAIRRAAGPRRAPRRVSSVEQVLRAPLRPLVQHVGHQHLTAVTVRLHVTAPLQVLSSTRTLRTHAAPGSSPAAPGLPPVAFPAAVLRTGGAPADASAAAPAVPSPPATSIQGLAAGAATRSATRTAHRPGAAPTRVELVHRQPTQSAAVSTVDRSRHEGDASAYSRPGALQTPTAQAPGATALTDADVPRVVDHVVRELDRRLVASRERRGWTS